MIVYPLFYTDCASITKNGIVIIEQSVEKDTILTANSELKPYFVANITVFAAVGALAATMQAISGMPLIPNTTITPRESAGTKISRSIVVR